MGDLLKINSIMEALKPLGKEHNGMSTELQGQIERITFTNEENGFTIAKVKVPGRQDFVFSTA